MPFSFQAASEPMQASIFPDDSMTGNDDRYWISTGIRAGGADGLRRACAFGQVRVGDSFSIRDERDFPPDPLLEIGTSQAQREREFGSFSREVFLKLLLRLLKNRVFGMALPAVTRGGDVITAGKIKSD